MRKLLAAGIVVASIGFSPASAQTPDQQPQPAATSPLPSATAAPTAPADVVRCPPRTHCLTSEMLPVGTPIKVFVTGWLVGKFNEHPAYGSATILPAEDVIVNGRLILLKGVPGRSFGGKVLDFVPPCSSITVAALFVWTEDYQILPVSFGDPQKATPNAFTFPLGREGLFQCRRSNVETTVYINGPPTLTIPKL